jgi:hypothetical protein
MAKPDKKPVTMEELLLSSLAQTDALAKLLIEKGLSSLVFSASVFVKSEASQTFHTHTTCIKLHFAVASPAFGCLVIQFPLLGILQLNALTAWKRM